MYQSEKFEENRILIFSIQVECHCISTIPPLHLVKPLLPIVVEGLQSACHLQQSQATALTLFHSIPLSFRIFCIPSFQACWGVPLGLFPCSSLPGHFGVSLISHSHNVPTLSQLCYFYHFFEGK
jgi:hypothetical protein